MLQIICGPGSKAGLTAQPFYLHHLAWLIDAWLIEDRLIAACQILMIGMTGRLTCADVLSPHSFQLGFTLCLIGLGLSACHARVARWRGRGIRLRTSAALRFTGKGSFAVIWDLIQSNWWMEVIARHYLIRFVKDVSSISSRDEYWGNNDHGKRWI